MSKYIVLGLQLLIMWNTSANAQQQFEKYKRVEAYEVRPGILMLPRYTAENQVCEIGIERLHYSPDLIRLSSSLSRKEIDQILDELVPAQERGAPAKGVGGSLITQGGQSLTTTMDFENVSIQIYGAASSGPRNEIAVDEVLATVKWKKRACRP